MPAATSHCTRVCVWGWLGGSVGKQGMQKNGMWFMKTPQIFVYFCSYFIHPTHSTLNHASAHTYFLTIVTVCHKKKKKHKPSIVDNSNVFRKVWVKVTHVLICQRETLIKNWQTNDALLLAQMKMQLCFRQWLFFLYLSSFFFFFNTKHNKLSAAAVSRIEKRHS